MKNVYICFNQLVNFYENTLPPLMLFNSTDRVEGVFGPITKKYILNSVNCSVCYFITFVLVCNLLFVSVVAGFLCVRFR